MDGTISDVSKVRPLMTRKKMDKDFIRRSLSEDVMPLAVKAGSKLFRMLTQAWGRNSVTTLVPDMIYNWICWLCFRTTAIADLCMRQFRLTDLQLILPRRSSEMYCVKGDFYHLIHMADGSFVVKRSDRSKGGQTKNRRGMITHWYIMPRLFHG